MTAWTCVIPGKPKPKGNSKRAFNGVVVGDPKAKKAEAEAKGLAYQQRPPAFFDGAIVVDVDFVFAIPASRTKGKRAVRVGDPHTQRPDRGNCLKLIEDVLENIAYADDAAVADGRVRKMWGERDETRVTVRHVDNNVGGAT